MKGDARSEPPSSSRGYFAKVRVVRDRYAGLVFAGFLFFHLACQAFRAWRDGALPSSGLELQPAFVTGALVLVWLPFFSFIWRELAGRRAEPATSEKARALSVMERISLGVVLLFTTLHGVPVVWPLLSGAQAPSDVRPELIAALSSTQRGLPLLAAGYLCGVGAATFFGARQVLRALGPAPSRLRARTTVAIGVIAYLLGSYAVIRCSGGTIWP